MKVRYTVIILLVLLLQTPRASCQTNSANYQAGQLFIKLKDSVADTINIKSPMLLPFVTPYHITACYRPFAGLGNDTLNRIYKIKFSNVSNTQALIDSLQKTGLIDYAERVPLYRTNFTPDDPQLSSQYHLKIINAEAAWNISKGLSTIVIAIVDNGVLTTHQDLAANISGGYDVADNDNNPSPPAGFVNGGWNHGTHVAGIAAATTNNGIGIASLGYNTKIMPVKCTSDTSTTGDDIDFADEGITYAMQNGATIINLSFGSYASSLSEQILIQTAENRGIILVAAAGNNDSSAVYYPAAYQGVICVGGTDSNDVKAPWSNYGSRVDVMAPGLNIWSTFASTDSTYSHYSGTSMSCPLVAALCALVKGQNPSWSAADVLNDIEQTADDISAQNPGLDGQLGAGRINAFHALGGVGTGVVKISGAQNIKMFPNPFSDYFELKLNEEPAMLHVELQDMDGRTVLNQSITNYTQPIVETNFLPSGVYLVKVTTDKGTSSGKLVKL